MSQSSKADCFFRFIWFYFTCASVYLHACMCSVYVQGPQNLALDTPTLECHAAVSYLVGAGAGTWPREEQQTLLTAELPLQPHGRRCDENMKAQHWLLPAGTSNPHYTLYPEWILRMFLFQHILFIWKILVY